MTALFQCVYKVIFNSKSSFLLYHAYTFHFFCVFQLQDIATNLVSDNEYLDWKAFLLSAAKPWPPVTVSGLLETLRQFKEADDLKIGCVGREDFEKVCR